MPPELLTVLQPWLAALGGFSAIAVLLVTTAYGLFRLFGVKWLDSKFEERLAAYKHAQQKELERLKFEINTIMDRTVKLHQREFDVLPEAWARVNDAFRAVHHIGMGMQSYPDVSGMSEPEIENLLERSEFEDWQKDKLREAKDKTTYYIKTITPIRMWKADKARAEFSAYFAKHGIFIPEPIKSQFETIDKLLFDATLEQRLSVQHPDMPRSFDSALVLHTEGRTLLKSLEADVQARLWNLQATTQAA
jgi:hypothetical protein